MDWEATATSHGSIQTVEQVLQVDEAINFADPQRKEDLRSLELADSPLNEISSRLEEYHSVLKSGSSIALGRGDALFSTRLSKGLETLFTTNEPVVVSGPQITWTILVLAAGPIYDGSANLVIGSDDCRKELEAIKKTREELSNMRDKLGRVFDEMSALDRELGHRHSIVARLLNDQEQDMQKSEPGCVYMNTGATDHGSSLGATVPETAGSAAPDNGTPFFAASTKRGFEQAAQLNPFADSQQEPPNLASASESEGVSGVEPVAQEADLRRPASHTEPFIQCLSE
ncbi:hypothetical protein CBS147353_11152 [Aspergillus niger]|nr:hypothetical protein CBS147353_11152 [Aspergillus niger]